MSLECPVCLELYTLTERQPKALRCIHTLCQTCVSKLGRGDSIQCPKCRRTCLLSEVVTNYAVNDVLEEQCEVCIKEKRAKQCNHCNKHLCEKCITKHADDLHVDVKKAIEMVRVDMIDASNASMDDSAVNGRKQKKDATIQQIREAFQKSRDALDQQQAEFEETVNETCDMDIKKHRQWTQTMDAQCINCKSFVRSAQDKLGTQRSKSCTMEEMVNTLKQSKMLSSKLQEVRQATPKMSEYVFKEAADSLITVGSLTGHQVPKAVYQTLVTKSMTGSKGEAMEQFKQCAQIDVNDDAILVADCDSHRLKVYNSNLGIKLAHGSEGSGMDEFKHPGGICSMNGEIYVSDECNGRIKVFDKAYKLARVFGSKGPGIDQFDRPVGLAEGPDGLLYVCDGRNYRVKVVQPDGKYVRSIGARGKGSGKFRDTPQDVAVTSNEKVLVRVKQATDLHVFTTGGQFLRLLLDDCSIPQAPKPLGLRGIAVDGGNNVIVCDYNNDRLLVLNPRGGCLRTIGTRGSQKGQLDGPWDVAVNKRGDIVVYEVRNHRLQVFGIDQ